jgi:hypothetical protein
LSKVSAGRQRLAWLEVMVHISQPGQQKSFHEIDDARTRTIESGGTLDVGDPIPSNEDGHVRDGPRVQS